MTSFSRLKTDAGPFDFLAELGYRPVEINRMNLRHRHIIDPIRNELQGARVLDLGSHDGRWPFALAKAGAASVFGIEGRADLIAKFSNYPEPRVKERVRIIEADFVQEMDRLVKEEARFDVVACLGVYNHTMHHYLMLMQMTQFQPKAIVIDSVFHLAKRPLVSVREHTDKRLNTIAQTENQKWAPIGHISRPALEMMAESLSYSVEWIDWNISKGQRKGVSDYFQHQKNMHIRRFTAVLRPAAPSTQPRRIEELYPSRPLDHGDVYQGSGHRLFVGAKWDEMGSLQLSFLRSQGLQPHHVFLDVACGSLRAGVKLIPYLNEGNYLGIEAETQLLKDGVEKELGRELFNAKKPELIASRSFEFHRFTKRPDYGIAQSLFTHLNEHDIRLCLGNLKMQAADGMRFFVTFFEGNESNQNPELSHAARYFEFSKDEMTRFGQDAGFYTDYIGDWGHPRNQNMFLYTA